MATAAGSLLCGLLVESLQRHEVASVQSYRVVLLAYVFAGVLLAGLFTRLSPAAEAPNMREVLYAADPLWNNGSQRVLDPRNLAWVSRTNLTELRPFGEKW